MNQLTRSVARDQKRMARDLACVDWASAAKTDQTIGVHALDFRLQLAHHAPWNVLPRSFEHRRASRARSSSNFREQRRAAQSFPGHNDGALQSPALKFFSQRRNFSRTRDNSFQPA